MVLSFHVLLYFFYVSTFEDRAFRSRMHGCASFFFQSRIAVDVSKDFTQVRGGSARMYNDHTYGDQCGDQRGSVVISGDQW